MGEHAESLPLLTAEAVAAQEQGDWATALAWWEQIAASFPDDPAGSVGAAECLARLDRLDEADAALALASARFPRERDILLAHARLAQQRKLWAEALTRWQTALRHAPANPEAMAGVAEALHGLGRGEEAAQFLAQLATRPSADLAPRIEQAQACEARGDTRGAYDHWLAVIEAFPGSAEGLAGAGTAAIRLGRLHEADGLLARGLTMHPAHATLAVEHARVAQLRADWPEALRRYHHVLARFPGRAEGFAGGGLALSMLGRGGEADELLRRGMELFPLSAPVAVEYARVAQAQTNWPEALRRWEQVMASFREEPEGPAGAATALRHLKRFAMLEQLLGAAVARFPAHAGLAAEHARAAQARQDWVEARQRWQAAQARFPDDPAIRDGLRAMATAEFNARLTSVDEGVAAVQAAPEQAPAAPIPAPEVTSNVSGSGVAELMMRFESLGSGCEFGVVQRHFGAEPISLLRWSGIAVGGLVAGLEARFAGVGEPDRVQVIQPDHADEYFFRDDVYGIYMHTFVPVAGTDYARLHAQQCRRVKYLAQKLIEALETPPAEYGKIFVYKQHAGDLSEAEIAALHGAIGKFGEHPLLCVRPPDAAHPDGTVEMRAGGLMIGRIDGLSDTSNENFIKYDTWLKVCRAADLLWRDRRSATVSMAGFAVLGHAQSAMLDVPALDSLDISGVAMAETLALAAGQTDAVAGAEAAPVGPARRGFFSRLFGGKRVEVVAAPAPKPPVVQPAQAAPPPAVAPAALPSDAAKPLVTARPTMEDLQRGRVQEARRLHGEKRYAEAELVVAEVLAALPADPDMLRLYADLAELRAAPAEAAPRWEAVAVLDLNDVGYTRADCYRRAIVAYGKAGQHDRAEAVASVAQDRFYDNPFIAVVCAYAAQDAGNWRLAQKRWERARDMAPDIPDGWVHGSRACSQLGLHDEAKEILAEAEWKFPEHQVGVQKFIAYAAEARQDWKDAVRVWRRVESLAPGDGEATGGLARCQYQVRLSEIDEAAAG